MHYIGPDHSQGPKIAPKPKAAAPKKDDKGLSVGNKGSIHKHQDGTLHVHGSKQASKGKAHVHDDGTVHLHPTKPAAKSKLHLHDDGSVHKH